MWWETRKRERRWGLTGELVGITGYISDIDAGTIAQVVWRLGAGRDKPDDAIDHTVGIRLLKHVGDAVKEGKLDDQ